MMMMMMMFVNTRGNISSVTGGHPAARFNPNSSDTRTHHE
jgi:hypothetical protein